MALAKRLKFELLADFLVERGIDVYITREPGGTRIGRGVERHDSSQ